MVAGEWMGVMTRCWCVDGRRRARAGAARSARGKRRSGTPRDGILRPVHPLSGLLRQQGQRQPPKRTESGNSQLARDIWR